MESKSTLRVALLGAGNISGSHLGALGRMSGVEVAGVCDLDYKKAVALQKSAGITNAYPDADTMLRECKPDIVHVLTPPPAHCEGAMTCLAAGSHVFVEKPFCMTPDECRQVGDMAKRTGRMVGVNHNMAFGPAMMRLTGEIRSGRLGAIEHVAVTYTIPMPGLRKGHAGPWMFGETNRIMLEFGPHPVSVVCRMLGPVQQASTTVAGELMLSNGTRFFTTWMTSMACERGTASIMFSVGGGYSCGSILVIGQDGEAYIDLRRNTLRISAKSRYIRGDDLVDGMRNGLSVAGQALSNFIAYSKSATGLGQKYDLQEIAVFNSMNTFYGAVRGGYAPLIGVEQGTNVIEACHKIIDSAKRFVEEREALAVR